VTETANTVMTRTELIGAERMSPLGLAAILGRFVFTVNVVFGLLVRRRESFLDIKYHKRPSSLAA